MGKLHFAPEVLKISVYPLRYSKLHLTHKIQIKKRKTGVESCVTICNQAIKEKVENFELKSCTKHVSQ